MDREMMEIREAVSAGRTAMQCLEEAKSYLSSAKGWGIWDMLGGGFFTNMVKHSKLNSATDCMERAKAELNRFKRELSDVQNIQGISIEIGSFLTFADFFFDGLVADWMVQNKIQDAQDQVEEALVQVKYLVEKLERMEAGM